MSDVKHKILEFSANERAPRYTSYPTAPNFIKMDGAFYGNWLSSLEKNQNISLYIHIPYCEKLCWFCGCSTSITSKYKNVENFTQFLLSEIDLVASQIGSRKKIEHLHFGGGSPTILNSKDFSAIMVKLGEHFDFKSEAEIAVEIDPRTVTRDKMKTYAKFGVNRISLGVQDFDKEVQTAINRIQPEFLVGNVIKWANELGITGINMDLIYGLPLQSLKSLESTIPQALKLNPDRISLFSYAHVPWIKKHQKLIKESDLPSADEKIEMFDYISKIIKSNGYKDIGLDHFAKINDPLSKAISNGTLHRNFQGYTTDQSTTMIALGPSAIGSLPQGYSQNTPSIKDYKALISENKLPTIRGRELTVDDYIYGQVIENLMCFGSVNLKTFKEKYKLTKSYFNSSLEALIPYKEKEVISINGDQIKLNPDYRLMVRSIAACFDQYLEKSEAKFSKVI